MIGGDMNVQEWVKSHYRPSVNENQRVSHHYQQKNVIYHKGFQTYGKIPLSNNPGCEIVQGRSVRTGSPDSIWKKKIGI
jgi:hypothetical protein